jgi:hypothetical protein
MVRQFRPLTLLLVLVCSCLLAAGCAAMKQLEPPSVEYVQADVKFDETFGPLIADWLARDEAAGEITALERQALDLALRAWQAMVRKAAGEVLAPAGGGAP